MALTWASSKSAAQWAISRACRFWKPYGSFAWIWGGENVIYVHVTLVPFVRASGEIKTKPTQHSVATLRGIGIQPDILLCRTEQPLDEGIKKKISLFCNVEHDAVIEAIDVDSVYKCPLNFHHEGLDEKIVQLLNIWTRQPRLESWKDLVARINALSDEVTIGIVGKYVDLKESYKSLNEALFHGGLGNNVKVNLAFVDSEAVERDGFEGFARDLDGILVPGGFGSRGIEGKIAAAGYARRNDVPYFGICYGMHMAVIEFARNAAGLEGAHSTEIDRGTPHPVIYLMKEWYDYRSKKVEVRDEKSDMGGTMRLGAYPCVLGPGSKAEKAYGAKEIMERHRHRYEFNNEYRQRLTEHGLALTGLSPDEQLVEIVEIKDHPWFLGCQFHPEFKSRPMNPHPLFRDFIKAAVDHKKKRSQC